MQILDSGRRAAILPRCAEYRVPWGRARGEHGEGAERQVDVILTFGQELSDRQRADLYQSWSQVGLLRAIRERRVRLLGGEEWESAGPRIALALHRFITVLSEFR